MLLEAIRTSHDNCHPDCLHAEACDGSKKAIEEVLQIATLASLEDGVNPLVMVFSAGLHIGYRFHEVATTPIPQDKVN